MSSHKCQVSSIKCQVSSFKLQVASVKFQASSVKCQVSNVEWLISSVKSQVSDVKCQVSSSKCQVASVKCQMSSITETWYEGSPGITPIPRTRGDKGFRGPSLYCDSLLLRCDRILVTREITCGRCDKVMLSQRQVTSRRQNNPPRQATGRSDKASLSQRLDELLGATVYLSHYKGGLSCDQIFSETILYFCCD